MFHVANRGIDHQDVFDVPADRELFESHLGRAIEQSDLEVVAYAWMTNHIHVLAHSPTGNLSEPVGEAQGRYTRDFNRRTDRVGPLWQPRFWATPIETEGQLLQTVRYIHRNPIDIVGTDGLLEYPYSSFGTYGAGVRAPEFLTPDRLLGLLDPERHVRTVLTPQPTDRLPFAELPALRRTTLDELAEAAAVVAPEASVGSSAALKLATLTLAVALRAGSVAQIAAHFDVTVKTVRNSAHRGRRRLTRDPAFRSLHRRIQLALPTAY